MTSTRRYVSPLREAQARATRDAIVDAFIEQLQEPGRTQLSPTDAAASAGCSVRTVHSHFPTTESRISAIAEALEGMLFPDGLTLPETADDLPEHYRLIHARAIRGEVSTNLLNQTSEAWRAVRAERRADRLDAVRRCVEGIGAPREATDDATAMLLVLAGGEISVTMRDQFDVDIERIPDIVADTVTGILDRLRSAAE
ncbi:MAG: hypothetical protein AAFZ07_03060 [Actinomycetota bacterium]